MGSWSFFLHKHTIVLCDCQTWSTVPPHHTTCTQSVAPDRARDPKTEDEDECNDDEDEANVFFYSQPVGTYRAVVLKYMVEIGLFP